jgi:NAD(P)H-dependent FMN reductase
MIHLTQSPNHPLPIALGPVIPAAITSPPSYPDPRIVSWSRTASSWDAIIIVSPQYNWGIPGVLKNSLDHLYNEWRGKPVAVFTLGGHGGGKCAEQLRMVCGGGLKMRVVDKMVRVTLPGEYIRGDKRVQGKGEGEEWLGGYEGEVRELLEGLKGLMGEVGKRSHRES